MRLRFVKDWMRFKQGTVADIPRPNLARELVRRGKAVAADLEILTASIEPTQTAVRKRGRPRKVAVETHG